MSTPTIAATAFLFPGQGSQYVGMGRDLFKRFAASREIFEMADARLGFSLSGYMFGVNPASANERASAIEDVSATEETFATQETSATEASFAETALKQTHITQPALYVHSMAAMLVLKEQGLAPGMAAGHSLGEYSALAATGAIEFEAGLDVVRVRGQLMAQAGERRPGSMAAILGMNDDDVVRVCRDATKGSTSVATAANFNAPGQVVISGDRDAVERAMTLASENGAKRVVSLPVSGAFHSPLMEYARDGLAEVLREIDIQRPTCPIYLNVTAEPTRNPEEIRRRLLEQLTAPVRWSQMLRRMHSDGAMRFVEVGAGNVLSGLVRRTLGREVDTATAGKAEELDMEAARNSTT